MAMPQNALSSKERCLADGDLNCGRRLEKLPPVLERCQQIIVEFFGVVQAAHLSFLPSAHLDSLALPSRKGPHRVAAR